MAKNPDWHQLSENLVRLQIVFPRAHSEGGYSPTPETLMNLIKNMKNIQSLGQNSSKVSYEKGS